MRFNSLVALRAEVTKLEAHLEALPRNSSAEGILEFFELEAGLPKSGTFAPRATSAVAQQDGGKRNRAVERGAHALADVVLHCAKAFFPQDPYGLIKVGLKRADVARHIFPTVVNSKEGLTELRDHAVIKAIIAAHAASCKCASMQVALFFALPPLHQASLISFAASREHKVELESLVAPHYPWSVIKILFGHGSYTPVRAAKLHAMQFGAGAQIAKVVHARPKRSLGPKQVFLEQFLANPRIVEHHPSAGMKDRAARVGRKVRCLNRHQLFLRYKDAAIAASEPHYEETKFYYCMPVPFSFLQIAPRWLRSWRFTFCCFACVVLQARSKLSLRIASCSPGFVPHAIALARRPGTSS